MLELIHYEAVVLAVLAEEEAHRDHEEHVEDQNVEHQPVEDLWGLIAAVQCLIIWGRCSIVGGLYWVHRGEVDSLAVEKRGQLEDDEHRPAEARASLLLNSEHAPEVDDGIHEVAGHTDPEGSLDAAAVLFVDHLDTYGPYPDTQEHQRRHQVEDSPLSAMFCDEFLILIVILVLGPIEKHRGLFYLLGTEVLGFPWRRLSGAILW